MGRLVLGGRHERRLGRRRGAGRDQEGPGPRRDRRRRLPDGHGRRGGRADLSSLQANRYRSFADLTSLLPSSGSSTVTVANLQAGTGQDRFGGWSLLVAYRNSALPIRRLDAYDGLGTVNPSQSFSTTIGPL